MNHFLDKNFKLKKYREAYAISLPDEFLNEIIKDLNIDSSFYSCDAKIEICYDYLTEKRIARLVFFVEEEINDAHSKETQQQPEQ